MHSVKARCGLEQATLICDMRLLPDPRRPRTPRPRTVLVPSGRGGGGGTAHEIRFAPAPWLLLLLGIARAVLTGVKIGKLGIAGLVWSFAPRAVKIAAAGAAVGALIVVAGALAAIALLVLQLS